jgi:hypothetical protein
MTRTRTGVARLREPLGRARGSVSRQCPGSAEQWSVMVARACCAACWLRRLASLYLGRNVVERCDFENGLFEAPDEKKAKSVCCVFVPDVCSVVMPCVLSGLYSSCRLCPRHCVMGSMSVCAIHAFSLITRSNVGLRYVLASSVSYQQHFRHRRLGLVGPGVGYTLSLSWEVGA